MSDWLTTVSNKNVMILEGSENTIHSKRPPNFPHVRSRKQGGTVMERSVESEASNDYPQSTAGSLLITCWILPAAVFVSLVACIMGNAMTLELFHPAVANWFAKQFTEPTPPQERAWPSIKNRKHTLIAAPTGSGKTFAAFLSAIDDLVRQGVEGPLEDVPQVVYVSP